MPDPSGPNARRPPLTDVLALAHAGTSLDDLLVAVATRTGWDKPDGATPPTAPNLRKLADALGLTAAAFTTPSALVALERAVRLSRTIKLPGARLATWKGKSDADLAREVKDALRSTFTPAAWKSVAPSLRDPLRNRQRDALVAYLIGHGATLGATKLTFEDADALFEHFLIDVEMSACQLTSRLKQAISATQLFIQKCLLIRSNCSTSAPKRRGSGAG